MVVKPPQTRPIRARITLSAGFTVAALVLGALAGCGTASGTAPEAKALAAPRALAGSLPCDIYASGGTPCVAAHSTTRALYAAYNGPLYQVKRASDGANATIRTLSAGGYADAAAQDAFCARASCVITEIYDQSGRGNNLMIGPAGGAGAADTGANALALPVMADGHKVYGVFTSPGMGYRDDHTSGVARMDQPEGEYAVFGGTHYNNGCCYDYGNAETSNTDTGAGHMEAIYIGTTNSKTAGPGAGPWIAADLENGLFTRDSAARNPNDPSMNDAFVTAIVKGRPHRWAIRGGNAQTGGLSTFWDGPRPAGYDPMRKEGAVILGVGGDNSNRSAGSFFEGAMTSGYPSDSRENAVQSSVTAARYTSPSGTAPFTPGTRVSIRATTACCTADYIAHDDGDSNVSIKNITASSPPTLKADATWNVVPGLANRSCVSLESANQPGKYLRHSDFQLHLTASDGTPLFANDATYCPRSGNSGRGFSLMSNNYSDHYIRHYGGVVYIASDGGPKSWDARALWPDDTTWLAAPPLS